MASYNEETRTYSEKCAWPINLENPIFQASQKLLVLEFWDNVASWTFHSAGGTMGEFA